MFRLFLSRTLLALLVVGLCGHASRAGDWTGDVGAKPETLKVLYAGDLGSLRMMEFKDLLELHFAEVGTVHYSEFTTEAATGYDVVIFDWTSIYHRDKEGNIVWKQGEAMPAPKPPKLDQAYATPTILIGGAGASIVANRETAINWKCLCLENYAHDTDVDHPIFQGPLSCELEMVEREKPFDYFAYPGSKKMGESMAMWKVHDKTFPEIDPGLVSSRERFIETPDAEVISGGVNGKGPSSVAIGRHGNFLLWGFAGSPSQMTPTGRTAFVNSVCYIEQFAGQKTKPARTASGREEFLTDVYALRHLSDEYLDKQVEKYQASLDDLPEDYEVPDKLQEDPKAYFRDQIKPYIDEHILPRIPEKVRQQMGGDTEALIRYYDENLEYLYVRHIQGQGDQYLVDEKVRKLGISNRSPKLLEKCVELLEEDPNSELAWRLISDYAPQPKKSVAMFKHWLATTENLKFVESTHQFMSVHGE